MELKFPNKKSQSFILNNIKDTNLFTLNQNNSALIKGDNFKALATLINLGYSGKIDLVYIDPPYNTNQNFTISTGRSSTISRSASQVVAYGDKMSKPEYLEFIRERLVLIKELMSDKGSIYLHIDTKIGHYIKIIMDEVFGESNYLNDITRIKSNPKNFQRRAYGNQKDLVLFYAKNSNKNIFNNVKTKLDTKSSYKLYSKIDSAGRRYTTVPVHAPGVTTNGKTGQKWRNMSPPEGRHWRTDPEELEKLDKQGLIEWSKTNNPRMIKYADEHTGKKIQDIWEYLDPPYPKYPTEKNLAMLDMIISQSSNPDSIVLDCFAGSGTTLLSAIRQNRRWIGIDQSSHAIDAVKQKLGLVNYQFVDISKL